MKLVPISKHRSSAQYWPPVPCMAIVALVTLALAGCGTTPKPGPSTQTPRGGGYYLDDGPGDNPPPDIDRIPDATPRLEPLKPATLRPYVANGKRFTPMTSLQPYRARGVATWYGRRYHGKATSSGEIYDMYAMTAAHPILPIPSYARVTNVLNGRSVIVRINDRGPFIDNREIDLSYAAAYKLGIVVYGSGMVEVESIIPGTGPAPLVASTQDRENTATASDARPAAIESTSVPAEITRPVAASQSEVAEATLPQPEESRPVVASAPRRANSDPPRPRPAPPPYTHNASGTIYVQLGAFSSQRNAQSYLARLQSQLSWLAGAIHIYPQDGLFRIQAGPYVSRREARSVSDRVSQSLGIKSFVLTR